MTSEREFAFGRNEIEGIGCPVRQYGELTTFGGVVKEYDREMREALETDNGIAPESKVKEAWLTAMARAKDRDFLWKSQALEIAQAVADYFGWS